MSVRLVVREGAPALPGDRLPYVHEQVTPAATWTILNPLGHVPQVTLIDLSGDVVFSDVFIDGAVQVVVTFPSPFAGSAVLS